MNDTYRPLFSISEVNDMKSDRLESQLECDLCNHCTMLRELFSAKYKKLTDENKAEYEIAKSEMHT